MRIFFDSRHRLPNSPSSSDFTLELLESIQLRPDSRVRLHDVSIPYSWRTVEANLNQYIYLEERVGAGGPAYRRLTLPVGQYDGRTLAAALQTALNAGAPWPSNPYTCTYSEQTGSVTILLSVAVAGTWVIWDDISLWNSPVWPQYDTVRPASFNRNLRIAAKVAGAAGVAWSSEFLDLLTVHDVYVCTSVSRSNVGPVPGQTDCLAKVAVTSGYGYIIHQEGSSWEFAECTVPILKQIRVQLRDSTGAIVPLHGCDWSACLTFDDPPE